MAIASRGTTKAEFEELLERPEYEDRRIELIEGIIAEKSLTVKRGLIVAKLGANIGIYLQQTPIGRVGTGIRTTIDEQNDYLPDVSVMLNTTPEFAKLKVAPRAPDLAIEIKSESNTLHSLRTKARHYLANGSRVVWIVLPELQLVEVYTADSDAILTANDTLTGGDLLPGFTLAVSAVFAV